MNYFFIYAPIVKNLLSEYGVKSSTVTEATDVTATSKLGNKNK